MILTRKLIFLFIAAMVLLPSSAPGQIQGQLEWTELPPIPDREGFAGMFVGVSGGALIAMGGTNFPDGPPATGGRKVWYDQIFVLEDEDSGWRIADETLPRPLAHGGSFTHGDRIILAGGSDSQRHYAEVYSVSYRGGRIRLDTLPSLPHPLANMAGAVVENVLYVAGGTESPTGSAGTYFFAYNIGDPSWIELDPWPGPGRIFPVGASLRGNFFLFSGILPHPNPDGSPGRTILRDSYKFIPAYQRNRLVGGRWIELSEMPRAVAAAPSPAPTAGLDHIFFPGGLDGNTARQAEIDPSGFEGFVTDLLAYHVESDSWVSYGNLPDNTTRVTVPAVRWNQRWVIPSGERGPGVRSPQVFSLSKTDLRFGWGNWMAVIIYMVLILWMGYVFSKRGKTTQDFFKASGRVPWWAAGISIYGTQMSAITFMAIPAIVFVTDWSLAVGSLMILAIVPVIVTFYLPFFRRLNVTSAYEYFEHRFNANVRMLGSLSFILFQLGRMGVVLYLPALAIASVTGIDIYLLIAIMGGISIIYTVMGGIEAVIWTDVLQVVVLLGGALFCIFYAISHIDGGLAGMVARGLEADKFTVIHLGWDPERLVLWVAIVGFFFLNLIPYTSDQTVVQRYLTVKDEKAAAQSLWTNGLIVVPGILVFFGLGTALFIFYQENPAVLPSEELREVLPYYIVHKLPVGIAGIVIAGVFAASMSSLDSSMNSISTAYVTDIMRRFRPNLSDARYLKRAKYVTVIVGVFGTASAMMVAALDIQLLYDLFQEIVGMLGGGLAGLFVLGIFTKRASAWGAICGLAAGVVMVWLVRTNTDVSVYLYGAVGVLTCVAVGYLMSYVLPHKKDVDGLTYYTLKEK